MLDTLADVGRALLWRGSSGCERGMFGVGTLLCQPLLFLVGGVVRHTNHRVIAKQCALWFTRYFELLGESGIFSRAGLADTEQ